MNHDEKFEALETRQAFQDDLLAKLDDALSGQQKQIFDLKAEVRRLSERVRELEAMLPDVEDDGRPPHY